MSLKEYLIQLDSADSNWELYVDPNDWDNFEISTVPIEGMVKLGNLSQLSFGYQSYEEALWDFLYSHKIGEFASFYYPGNGRTIRVKIEEFIEAYVSDELDPKLRSFLDSEIEKIHQQWSINEVELFLEDLQSSLG